MSQLRTIYRSGSLGPHSPSAIHRSGVLTAVLLSVFLAACEKTDNSVIDSLGTPPYIVSGAISPSNVNLDTITQNQSTVSVIVQARISHTDGQSAIARALCTLTDATGYETLATGQMVDDGISPDTQAADSIFTATLDVPAQSLLVGKYTCQIVATSLQGYSSSTLLLPLDVIRQANRAPVLLDLQAPDTIVLGGQSHQFKLEVKATDPDGQSDIAKVFFNSFKPNGSPASGNPFQMFDDGSENIIYPPDTPSGDDVKGDSIYTLGVTIDASNATGTYRFEFQAVDRSNVYSQKIIWFIQVDQ